MFLPKAERRPWVSVSTSAVLHTALIILAILLTRHENELIEEQQAEQRSAEQREHVVPFFLPPPPPPKPVKPPQPPPPQPPPRPQPKVETPPPTPVPVAPPPQAEQRKPEPEPNAPPDEKRSVGTAEPEDKNKGAKAPDDAARSGAPPADIAMTAMESEAKRIFGRKKEGPPAGAGPRDVRPLETYLPDRPDKCTPKPVAPAESAGAPQMGVAVGRIFRGDNGRPLAGAHLVMLGTPYTSFTDDQGEYTFRFDLSLVDNCRTQYVRVSAQGYESRLLVLVVGPRTRSEDVMLRRRR
jgi:outer membrane biosynthesis protein TonB